MGEYMGSPPGLPLKTRHVVAVVFGCLCLGGPPDLLEPVYGSAYVQPATYCLCPARCLPLRYWLPHALCCRIPRNMAGRAIWPLSLSNVKDSKASFSTSTSTCGGTTAGVAGTSACTVSGEVIFSQNTLKDVLCGNNGGLTINLKGSGMKTGNKYKLYVDSAGLTTCLLPTATRKEIVEITAPVVGVDNGINVYMYTDGYNVDGSNSKTGVDGYSVAIVDTTSTATTVACGTAVLA